MSNEVYGYFEGSEVSNKDLFFKFLEEKTGIGVKSILVSELYNYPERMAPIDTESCIAFVVGDKPGKTNTSYLTDYVDYALDTDIGFPCKGKARLQLLIDFLMTMIQEAKATRFVVAITDSSQIEEVKTVNLAQLESKILADFEECAPPDCLYDVVVG
ncbi:hypothetical protein [Bacterioplanoides pacificum]|uniref:Uncharacterized protein n=1 Tax=Bacterioplanoides pacificum TaxID=1171596 RepID=A0ABV7VS00_9GAMM